MKWIDLFMGVFSQRRRDKRKYKRLTGQGLCRCGKKAVEGRVYCADCTEKNRLNWLRRKAKRREGLK